MLYFAAILDYNYLGRLIGLYGSLNRHHDEYTLFVICLDDKLYQYLEAKKNKNIVPLKREDLEEFYPELKKIKEERAAIDYLFTLSPYYPSYILEKYPEIPFICSLDVDQYFFANSGEIFNDLDNHSILITPHRFTETLKSLERHGVFNVSFQVFKNDQHGKECLRLWRSQCYEWCKDELEDGKFADQKYLESWVQHFGSNVKVIDNIGLGLAPWNLNNYNLSLRKGHVFVDKNRLILFHYQGLRFATNNLVNSGLAAYGAKASQIFIKFILTPIVISLSKINSGHDKISRISYEAGKGFISKINYDGMFYLFGNRLLSMNSIVRLKEKKYRISGLFTRLKNLYR